MNECTHTTPCPICTEGIKAIIFLQGLNNTVESEEQAKRGWASMSKLEKEVTMSYYSQLKPSEDK